MKTFSLTWKNHFRCLFVILLAVAALFPAIPALASEHFSLPDKELSAYAEKVSSLSFVTNDGAPMTYGSAIEEICDIVQKHAQKVNPALTEKQLAAMRSLIAKRIYLQQYGTDRRFIGDHGVRHIYGNIGRSLHLLAGASDAAKITAAVAQIYHDISYTDPDILFGVPNENGALVFASDADHDIRSWDYFTQNDLGFWQELSVFSAADLATMKEAVALHNLNVDEYAERIGAEKLTKEEEASIRNRIQTFLDVRKNPIVAAVHLGDRLALSEREKIPLILEYSPAVMEDFVRAYGVRMLKKDVEKKNYTQFAASLPTIIAKDAQTGLGNSYCQPEAYNGRDITPDRGKRWMAMNFVQTGSDCLSLREIDGMPYAEITLEALDYDSGAKILGEEIASRQFYKVFRDAGVPKNKIPALVQKAFAGGAVLPESHIIVRFQTVAMEENDERRAMRQSILHAASSSPIYRWGLLDQEIRKACKAGAVDDLTVQKMRSLLEEVGGTDDKSMSRFEEQQKLPPNQRDAKALLDAFSKCLKKSPLQDIIEALWERSEKSAA